MAHCTVTDIGQDTAIAYVRWKTSLVADKYDLL